MSGKGLERGRFEALLRASRERNTAASAKKTDLRKEVALKAHRNKQCTSYRVSGYFQHTDFAF